MLLKDVEDFPKRIVTRRGVVHDAAVCLRVLRELLHVVVEVLGYVVAHFHCVHAQLLPAFAHLFDELAALDVEGFLGGLDGIVLEIVREALVHSFG